MSTCFHYICLRYLLTHVLAGDTYALCLVIMIGRFSQSIGQGIIECDREGIIATGAADDAIRLFGESEDHSVDEPSYRLLLKKEKAHAMDINSVQWSPTANRLLASASDDGTIKIWKLELQASASASYEGPSIWKWTSCNENNDKSFLPDTDGYARQLKKLPDSAFCGKLLVLL
ncbi:CIA1-like protein [Tanacetum coccineum]